MTPAWHLSYFDRLSGRTIAELQRARARRRELGAVPLGSWLPFFYNDKKRTFFVLPSLARRRSGHSCTTRSVTAGDPYYSAARGPRCVRWVERSTSRRTTLDSGCGSTCGSISAFPERARRRPAARDSCRRRTRRPRSPSSRLLIAPVPHAVLPLLSGPRLADRSFQCRQFHFQNFYHPFVCEFAQARQQPAAGHPRADEPRDAAQGHRLQLPPARTSRPRAVVEPTDRRSSTRGRTSTSRRTAPTRRTTGSCSSTRRCSSRTR